MVAKTHGNRAGGMGEFDLMKKTLRPGEPVSRPPKPRSEEEIFSQWKSDPNNPLVTILCITYDHEPYIEDALNSFLAQDTDFPFEIWVHDDASTDGTREIIERYQAAYPRIVKAVLQKENKYSQGYQPLRFLRDVCRGKYCALCEGDDYWVSAQKLTRQVAAMERNPASGLSIHPAYQINVTSNRTISMFDKGNAEAVLDVAEAVASANQYSPTASYFFRTKEFQSMPRWFFEARDLPLGDYFIESIMGRNGLVYLPDLYSVYRRNTPGSFTERTSRTTDEKLVARMQAVLSYTDKLKEYPEIPRFAIQHRRSNVFLDYQNMAITRNSFEMFQMVQEISKNIGETLPHSRELAGTNKITFVIFVKMRRVILLIKNLAYRYRIVHFEK